MQDQVAAELTWKAHDKPGRKPAKRPGFGQAQHDQELIDAARASIPGQNMIGPSKNAAAHACSSGDGVPSKRARMTHPDLVGNRAQDVTMVHDSSTGVGSIGNAPLPDHIHMHPNACAPVHVSQQLIEHDAPLCPAADFAAQYARVFVDVVNDTTKRNGRKTLHTLKGDFIVTRNELRRLRVLPQNEEIESGDYMLSCEIMNCCMSLLQQRMDALRDQGHGAKYVFMPTSFYVSLYPYVPQLQAHMYTYSGGQKYTRVKAKNTKFNMQGIASIFEAKKVFVPVHVSRPLHWTLAVIDMGQRSFTYYCSAGGEGSARGQEVLRNLKKFLVDVKRDVHMHCGSDVVAQFHDIESWPLHHARNAPQQSNGVDCGVFVCKYAELIALAQPLTFTQQDIPRFRQEMGMSLALGHWYDPSSM